MPKSNRFSLSVQLEDPNSLDAASEKIQSCFRSGQIPADLEKEISRGVQFPKQSGSGSSRAVFCHRRRLCLTCPLPGQQDTYLNIVGETSLLDAVVRCWASLWTARAIGYRARNAISHEDVSLAVVVQQMVQSEASGVLFTANPLTGKRC